MVMSEPVAIRDYERKPKPPMAAVRRTADIIVLPMIRFGHKPQPEPVMPCDCGCSER